LNGQQFVTIANSNHEPHSGLHKGLLVGGPKLTSKGSMNVPGPGADAAGDVPPTDEEGFMAFARSLKHPIIAQMIEVRLVGRSISDTLLTHA
jgi:hypothetical protein